MTDDGMMTLTREGSISLSTNLHTLRGAGTLSLKQLLWVLSRGVQLSGLQIDTRKKGD